MKVIIAAALLFTALACNKEGKYTVTPPDVKQTNNAVAPAANTNPGATTTSDQEITRKLRDQMATVDLLSPSVNDVQILTQNGVVKLEGTVKSKSASSTLLSLANDIPGVTKVENKLSVKD